jgi:hypothetical protein
LNNTGDLALLVRSTTGELDELAARIREVSSSLTGRIVSTPAILDCRTS